MKSRVLFLLPVLVASLAAASPALAQNSDGQAPVVRGVLFFSPTCPHCEAVINEHLPGIFEEHGGEPQLFYDETVPKGEATFYEMTNGTLDLLLVDVTTDRGAEMYLADTERIPTADDRQGVPRLTMGDRFWVGDQDIPAELPGLIEQGLADGGVPWPEIPGIDDAIAAVPGMAERDGSASGNADSGRTATDETTPGTTRAGATDTDQNADAVIPSTNDQSTWDRFSNDPLGNGVAVVVLLLMLVSLALVPILVRRGALKSGPTWLIPLLALVGVAVAAYLGFVETSGTEAVCGPVGNCNAVQQSRYATVFGIHVGVLGIIGYAALLGAWMLGRFARGRLADVGALLALLIAASGTLFSIYLTFLEPFVIGATCMWCITSAVTITALLWLTARDGASAYGRLVGPETPSPERA